MAAKANGPRGLLTAVILLGSAGVLGALVWTVRTDAAYDPSGYGARPISSPDQAAPGSVATDPSTLEGPESRRTLPREAAGGDRRGSSGSDPVAAEASAPDQDQGALDEEQWRRSFNDASIEEILAAKERILADIDAESGPILDRLHAAGFSEYVGAEPDFDASTLDNLDIARVYMEPGRGTFLIKLPADQYPELYQQKARALWLGALAHDWQHHSTAKAR